MIAIRISDAIVSLMLAAIGFAARSVKDLLQLRSTSTLDQQEMYDKSSFSSN